MVIDSPWDLLLANGRVVDGTGSPWFRADVAVRGDRIAAVAAELPPRARAVVDVTGRVVAPGFIDMHSHNDLLHMVWPTCDPKIRQGITTEVVGQDGCGPAPVRPEFVAQRRENLAPLDGDPDLDWDWPTFAAYLEALVRRPGATNVAALATHGAVRSWVMGHEARPARPDEIAAMRPLVAEAMEAGAVGLSTGLIYNPCRYAETAELEALYAEAAARGGILVAHVRNEAEGLPAALEEMAALHRATGVPLHISHLKLIGRKNWHLVDEVLGFFEGARAAGIDITFDQYPYTAGSTLLSVVLPPWARDGGVAATLERLRDPAARERMRRDIAQGIAGWENIAGLCGWEGIMIAGVASAANSALEGETVDSIARGRRADPFEVVADLLLQERMQICMVDFYGCEENVRAFAAHRLQTVGTDGVVAGRPHPRLWGTFPRILGRFVHEEAIEPLEEAVRKMTSAAANRLGLSDRGLVRPGMAADLVVFDPETVTERATYAEPELAPAGIEWVFVNGVAVVEKGAVTGATPGRVLR
jgi:N-acyl-D-amino-acid deacylase